MRCNVPGELNSWRRRAMCRLRIPLVLLVAWGLFLIFDPTGEAPDTFRRWLDSVGRFAVAAPCTFLAAGLLGAVTWTTAARAVVGDRTRRPVR